MLQLEQFTKNNNMNLIKYIFITFVFILFVEAKDIHTLESQPEILFQYKELTKNQDKIALRVKFNRAVLLLEKKQYAQAIVLFKQTAKILKVPSFLNIGIAYHKLKSQKNAFLYLKQIYDIKETAQEDAYSYMSAAYYLYKITNDRSFIEDIIQVASKKKRLSEHVKTLIVDTYIELGKYKKALKVLETIKRPSDLKLALLNIKIGKYNKAIIHLDKALKVSITDDVTNKILWFKIYANLKANNIARISGNLEDIKKQERIFKTNLQMPLVLYFNKNKHTAKDYFTSVTNFSVERKIDFIFYFAPFIFSDNEEIEYEEKKAFILKNKYNMNELDMMIEYNAKFIKIIKKDPIKRVFELQKLIDKSYDTKSYEYYNLGLCYAQIDDFHKAYKYFNKAYGLNKKNKLFSTMTLLSASRVNAKLSKIRKEKLHENILSNTGTYTYYSQYIYKMLYKKSTSLNENTFRTKLKESIFFRALYFIDHIDKKGIHTTSPLLVEFEKDPLVHLFKLMARNSGESDYQYMSRIQDTIPVKYNDIFVKGPLIITRYYIDILKALGMFHIANLNIDNDKSATYYRTKALIDLYNNNSASAISLIEQLQTKYNVEDRYTYFLLIAALLESDQKEDAFITLSLVQALLRDSDANFLTGVELIQSLKLTSAVQYFKDKYHGELIDIKLVGLDEYLNEL